MLGAIMGIGAGIAKGIMGNQAKKRPIRREQTIDGIPSEAK